MVECKVYLMISESRIDQVRKVALTIKCTFDFGLFPNDEQSCDIVPKVDHYSKSQVNIFNFGDERPLTANASHEVVATTTPPKEYFSFTLNCNFPRS
jgi:hypothetical protein